MQEFKTLLRKIPLSGCSNAKVDMNVMNTNGNMLPILCRIFKMILLKVFFYLKSMKFVPFSFRYLA